ncbi:MAG: hacA, partial [Firmicutes bacterium]|nr:hacA [Bacillota bacterium]
KDIILELLSRLSVKGGVGRIFEYSGPGLAQLSVPERATITNMGAELGATTSIFPSDEQTQTFLASQGRADAWVSLTADDNARYDEEVIINLNDLEPLIAKPHSPDNVVPVRELSGIALDQVLIGSCTNSSYSDLLKVAKILEGKSVHPNISLAISPGSKQVLAMLARDGALAAMIQAGARILECACGPCIGMGQAPRSGGISLRTFNRNFEGRSGTPDAQIYLTSPEVAAASALTGVLTDPRDIGNPPVVNTSVPVIADNSLLILPPENGSDIEIIRGPNIKPFPRADKLPLALCGEILLKPGDNITTDHIMPSHAHLLPYRSNIPHLANYCFHSLDPTFPERAKLKRGGFIVAGTNYGQGSSREHAALAPLYLGIKGVIAQSFARIHRANLINFGIVPFTFNDISDYAALELGTEIMIENIQAQILAGDSIQATYGEAKRTLSLKIDLTSREQNIIFAGGLLNHTREKGE